MEHLFFNEEWNQNYEKQEHNINSISDYNRRTPNPFTHKKRDYLSDLYFFE